MLCFDCVLRCFHLAYGQLLEHLVYCPILLFVHCYCCFCSIWANRWMNEPGASHLYQFLPARRYASAGNSDRNVSVRPSVRLSVCLSVTRRYCVKTKKASIGNLEKWNSVKWNETHRIGAIFACFYVARVWQRRLGFLVFFVIISYCRHLRQSCPAVVECRASSNHTRMCVCDNSLFAKYWREIPSALEVCFFYDSAKWDSANWEDTN